VPNGTKESKMKTLNPRIFAVLLVVGMLSACSLSPIVQQPAPKEPSAVELVQHASSMVKAVANPNNMPDECREILLKGVYIEGETHNRTAVVDSHAKSLCTDVKTRQYGENRPVGVDGLSRQEKARLEGGGG